jgi:hypothetical protein
MNPDLICVEILGCTQTTRNYCGFETLPALHLVTFYGLFPFLLGSRDILSAALP